MFFSCLLLALKKYIMWFKPKAARNGTPKSPRQTLQCPGIPALIHQSERGLEVTLVSKQLRKGAVLSCEPSPSSPKDLMHHGHRYRLFAGSDLRRRCQCLSAASLGHSKENNSPSLKAACTFTGIWRKMNETSERGCLFFPIWDWSL